MGNSCIHRAPPEVPRCRVIVAGCDVSLKAIGLLATLTAHPDITMPELRSICKEKDTALRNAIKELENAGYITFDWSQFHEGSKKIKMHSHVTETQRGRYSKEYAPCRNAVYKRDGFSCQKCGKRSCKLNAHHIKPWAKFPDLRFDLTNGMTLCEKCHRAIHSKYPQVDFGEGD